MATGASTPGGVLRRGSELAEPRLRACAEHTPHDDDDAAAVVAALRHAGASAMRARSWGTAKLDGPKFCSYPAEGFFRAHRDSSTDPHDPPAIRSRVLSIVCVLNDDDPRGGMPTFDGGALVIYVPQQDGSVAPVNLTPPAGSIVAFPADLLHEVRPVRSGTRFTSIAWLYDHAPSDPEEKR